MHVYAQIDWSVLRVVCLATFGGLQLPRLLKRSRTPLSQSDFAAKAAFSMLFIALPLVYHPSPTHVGILVGLGFAYAADSVMDFFLRRNRSRA
jgi:hypothetical protein